MIQSLSFQSSGLSLVTVDNATPPPMSDVQDMTTGSNMSAAVLTADHLEMLADYSGSLGLFTIWRLRDVMFCSDHVNVRSTTCCDENGDDANVLLMICFGD